MKIIVRCVEVVLWGLGAVIFVGFLVWATAPVQRNSGLDQAGLRSLMEQVAPKGSEEPHVPEVSGNKGDRVVTWHISDRNYADLSLKWRVGVKLLLATGVCDRFNDIIRANVMHEDMFLFVKAQMIVESGCRPDAVSSTDARGLFQVKEIACRDVGLEGNLYEPSFNASCALKYRKALCQRYGNCTLSALFVSYNKGPGGIKSVRNAREHFYARKIDYVLEALVK